MKIDIVRLLNIGIALSREKNRDNLLYIILKEAMDITNCDGGTLYVCEEGSLYFKIMITLSLNICQGRGGEPIMLPPIPMKPENVCSYTAMKRELVNIPDVYTNKRYDFSGPKNFDEKLGYRSCSMLVVPMEDDKGQVIGVLQLINAKDENGKLIPFDEEFEAVISCLASQAAISIANMNYSRELQRLFDSFVSVMSDAIDARTPYNANHTRNMAKYAKGFLDYLDREDRGWRLPKENERQFLMSVWLHDIGKLVIPLEIMDKDSRLGNRIKDVESRFTMMGVLNRLSLAEGAISPETFAEKETLRRDTIDFLLEINKAGFLPDEKLERVKSIGSLLYVDEKGETKPWITREEEACLSIRKGTLTPDERRIMESHVEMTSRFLEKMHFTREFQNVLEWASSHHEFINGTGYPRHINGEGIPREVRLLTILDIFESLTARDRPYKPPMTPDKALGILEDMSRNGQVDKEILGLFAQSRAWEDGE